MTDSPTFNRTSKISNEIAKIRTRIPSAGSSVNLHLLRANQQTSHRSDSHLKLDLESILDDFCGDDKKKLEVNQVNSFFPDFKFVLILSFYVQYKKRLTRQC